MVDNNCWAVYILGNHLIAHLHNSFALMDDERSQTAGFLVSSMHSSLYWDVRGVYPKCQSLSPFSLVHEEVAPGTFLIVLLYGVHLFHLRSRADLLICLCEDDIVENQE
mmetsp:Transcript_15672/g.20033  ORF Transcript_15672/g.20033 Transcript_15672/m.20033 type:complete len:109 (+) Transcript_15672:490-816(+)